MSDVDLRGLERRLDLTPEDGRARFELATALARAGRRGEALARLELARVPDEWFGESKRLADDLWHQELSSFEPAFTVGGGTVELCGFEPDSRWLAARRQTEDPEIGELDAEILVLGLADGRPLATIQLPESSQLVAASAILPARGSLFVNELETMDRYIVTADDGAKLAESLPHQGRSLVDLAPSGAWLLLENAGFVGVARWPQPLSSASLRWTAAEVDWHRELVVQSSGRINRFDGRPGPSLQLRPSGAVHSLGHGVVAERGSRSGLWLHSLDKRWNTTLLDGTDSWIPRPSLSSDARGVRVLLGDRPIRFDVDLASGKLRSGPPRSVLERVASVPANSMGDPGRWHPCADVVALESGPHLGKLLALDGSTLLELPRGSSPVAWSPDGRSLAVISSEDHLELWRSPTNVR